MSDVFISYSRNNMAFARRLIDKLNAVGKDYWIDWEDIYLTSPNWWTDIKLGIEGAHNFVFVMTPDSVASIVCNMELDYAFQLGKRVIPLLHEEIKNIDDILDAVDKYQPDEGMQLRLEERDPPSIVRENWRRLGDINWIFLRDEDNFEEAFQALLRIVDTDLSYVKAHTRYLTRAKEWERESQREDLLLFGKEIDIAETWLQQAQAYTLSHENDTGEITNPPLRPIQHKYITISREAENTRLRHLAELDASRQKSEAAAQRAREEAQKSHIARHNARRMLTGVAILSAIIILGTFLFTTNQLQTIEATLTESELRFESLSLASDAAVILNTANGNRETALLLSLRAFNTSQTHQAETALLRSIEQMYPSQTTLTDHIGGLVDDRSVSYDLLIDEESRRGVQVVCIAIESQMFAFPCTNTVQIFDIDTGEIHHHFSHAGYPIHATQILSERGWLMSASILGIVTIHDIVSGERIYYHNFRLPLLSATMTEDGEKIVLLECITVGVSCLTRVKQYSIDTNEMDFEITGYMVDSLEAHVILTADGDGALVTEDDIVSLYDFVSRERTMIFADHVGDVTTIALSEDGTYLVTGGVDSNVRLWDVQTGDPLRIFTGHTRAITQVRAMDELIVSTSEDGTARVWHHERGHQHTLSGHTGAVMAGLFDMTHGNVITLASDSTRRNWQINHASTNYTVARSMPISDPIYLFNPVGDTMIRARCTRTENLPRSNNSVCVNSAITIENIMPGLTNRPISIAKGGDRISVVALSNDGKLLFTYDGDARSLLWNTENPQTPMHELQFPNKYSVWSALFSEDDKKLILSGMEDNNSYILIWDIESRTIQARVEVFSPPATMYLDASGRLFGDGISTYMWDFEHDTAEQLPYTDLRISGNGRYLLGKNERRDEFTMTDLNLGTTVRQFVMENTGLYDINNDGTRMLVSIGNTLQLIDMATGEVLQTTSYEGRPNRLQFVRDDNNLIVIVINHRSSNTLLVLRQEVDNLIRHTCQIISRDLTLEEKSQYGIPTDDNVADICMDDSMTQ